MSDQIYAVTATATGGGRDGHVSTSDGVLNLDVRPPKEMGGAGGAANPESLFAAAWSVCFNGALQLMMKQAGVDVAKFAPTVVAHTSLNHDPNGGYMIGGEIVVSFENQAELEGAAELVAKAHEFCPYSKALRGVNEISARLA